MYVIIQHRLDAPQMLCRLKDKKDKKEKKGKYTAWRKGCEIKSYFQIILYLRRMRMKGVIKNE